MISFVLSTILILSFISLGIIIAFTLSAALRSALPFYDPIADWVGHGLPDIGMIYMAFVMLGSVSAFFSFSGCAIIFALCAGVFVFRIATNTSFVWWQDVLHGLGALTKSYMFVSVVYWQKWITVIAILYYLFIIFLYMRRTVQEANSSKGISTGRFLFNLEHVVMSIGAILMFILMQWPEVFLVAIDRCPVAPSLPHHKH